MQVCKQCNREYDKPERKFCSAQCHHESMKIYSTCLNCGIKYNAQNRNRGKDKQSKFCSYSCFASHNKGENNPMFKNAKLKSPCKTCGIEFSYFKNSSSGIYCSQKCSHACKERLGKMSASKTQTFDGVPDRIIKARLRESRANKAWIYAVFQRDGFKCVKCGSKNNIQAHHIIPFSSLYLEVKILYGLKDLTQLFDIDNGETLCGACHRETDTYFKAHSIKEKILINTMEKVFNQDPEGYQTFPSYYENKMELIINRFKEKLNA